MGKGRVMLTQFGVGPRWGGFGVSAPDSLLQLMQASPESRLDLLVKYIEESFDFSKEVYVVPDDTRKAICTLLFSTPESAPAAKILMRFFVGELTTPQQLILLSMVESIMKKEPMEWRELLEWLVENISNWSVEAQDRINRLLSPRVDLLGREALKPISQEASTALSNARMTLFVNHVTCLLRKEKSNEKWPSAISYLYDMLFTAKKEKVPILLYYAALLMDHIGNSIFRQIYDKSGQLKPTPEMDNVSEGALAHFFYSTLLRMRLESKVEDIQFYTFAENAESTRNPLLWLILQSCYENGVGIEKDSNGGKARIFAAAQRRDVGAIITLFTGIRHENSPFTPEEKSRIIDFYLTAVEEEIPHLPPHFLFVLFDSPFLKPTERERIYHFFAGHPDLFHSLKNEEQDRLIFVDKREDVVSLPSYYELFSHYVDAILKETDSERLAFFSRKIRSIAKEEPLSKKLAERMGLCVNAVEEGILSPPLYLFRVFDTSLLTSLQREKIYHFYVNHSDLFLSLKNEEQDSLICVDKREDIVSLPGYQKLFPHYVEAVLMELDCSRVAPLLEKLTHIEVEEFLLKRVAGKIDGPYVLNGKWTCNEQERIRYLPLLLSLANLGSAHLVYKILCHLRNDIRAVPTSVTPVLNSKKDLIQKALEIPLVLFDQKIVDLALLYIAYFKFALPRHLISLIEENWSSMSSKGQNGYNSLLNPLKGRVVRHDPVKTFLKLNGKK